MSKSVVDVVEHVSTVSSALLKDESSETDGLKAVLHFRAVGQKRLSVEETVLTFSGISSVINVEDSIDRFRAMIWSMMSISSCRCLRRSCRRVMHLRQREAIFRELYWR